MVTRAKPERMRIFIMDLCDGFGFSLQLVDNKKTKRLPDVVFESGVYWLITYTACTIVLVNLNTDVFLGNRQSNVVDSALGLHSEERAISVEQMWTFIEQRLILGLLDLEDKVIAGSGQVSNRTVDGFGYMLISPVQFHQIRVLPFSDSGEHIQETSKEKSNVDSS
ncbi:hypothetical protein PoB_001600900 [Plakobranchus ocellatus]|uniref:Uncharacterized protein n=1 Tax=Plakobranchus ocellatus TaxID=259542 RepID=A0AAV3Z2F7_9GAST|nr:hypothetical protein PoB_001600900 [Plakobranchus ocellatus]